MFLCNVFVYLIKLMKCFFFINFIKLHFLFIQKKDFFFLVWHPSVLWDEGKIKCRLPDNANSMLWYNIHMSQENLMTCYWNTIYAVRKIKAMWDSSLLGMEHNEHDSLTFNFIRRFLEIVKMDVINLVCNFKKIKLLNEWLQSFIYNSHP